MQESLCEVVLSSEVSGSIEQNGQTLVCRRSLMVRYLGIFKIQEVSHVTAIMGSIETCFEESV